MALRISPDQYTDHITWASRALDESDHLAAGHTPVTAPGPLEGVAYSKVFRRKGNGQFAVKGARRLEGTAGLVIRVATNLGVPVAAGASMFSSYRATADFLDGGLRYYSADYGFSGSPTLDLIGNKVLRLVCHRLGIVQPRQFADETEPPDIEAIEIEFRSELFLELLGEPTARA